jgi:hypothetical protein
MMDSFSLEKLTWGRLTCGYLFANLVGSLLIWMVMKQMRKMIVYETPAKYGWQPHVTGVIERTLYMISLLVGKPEFIVGWLVYKVAVGWKVWDGSKKNEKTDSKDPNDDDHKGRAMFSNHFNGSALSILYAFFGYLIILYWDIRALIFATLLAGMTVVLTFILVFYKKYIAKDHIV